MGLHEWFNLGEGILWITIGTALLISVTFYHARWLRLRIVAALAFVLFGISDFIEMQTGSWWKPIWLLAIKACCVISLAICWWVYARSKTQHRE
jgi:hypothetical protein